MKNFSIIDDNTGREYWISRSVAVLGRIYAKDKNGNNCILAVKRGKGCPDYVGYWCLPCGYLDYDETLVQAVQREVIEETGLNIPTSDFRFVNFEDRPDKDKRQNITFRYVTNLHIPVESLEKLFTTKNSEPDEVDEIKFIPLSEVNNYNWAFNHKYLI